MKIGNSKLFYVIEDEQSLEKINILQGDSATGKSRFVHICNLVERGVLGYTSTCSIPIHVIDNVNASSCNQQVTSYNNSLLVIDEDSPFLNQDLEILQKVICESNNKFIVISRDKRLNLPANITVAKYTISYRNHHNFITRSES